MLSKLMNELNDIGYVFFYNEKESYIKIEFPECYIEVHETLADKLFAKSYDYDNKLIAKGVYKTTKGVRNFFITKSTLE